MRRETRLLTNATKTLVMVDCLVDTDKGRLEAGWVAFSAGDLSPTVLLTGQGLEVEIELPISRRHFGLNIMQHNPDEAIFFDLTPQYLKTFRGNREL